MNSFSSQNSFRVYFNLSTFDFSGHKINSFDEFSSFFKPKFDQFAKKSGEKFDFTMFATTGKFDGCFDFNFHSNNFSSFDFFEKFSFFLRKEFSIKETKTVQFKRFETASY